MTLRALIFDVDGTLADTEETHRLAFNEAFLEQGLDWNWTKPRYAQLLLTTGGKERIAVHVNDLGLPAAQRGALLDRIPSIHERKTAIYARMIAAGGAPLRAGVRGLLDAAHAAGVKLAIATTTTLANIEALLRTNLGPDSLARFDVIGAGDCVARKKPAPDVYEWVIARLGVPRQACVAVEDSANGLAAAKGAGLFTIITPSYWTSAEDFAAADWVVPSLERLSGLADIEHRLGQRAAAGNTDFIVDQSAVGRKAR